MTTNPNDPLRSQHPSSGGPPQADHINAPANSTDAPADTIDAPADDLLGTTYLGKYELLEVLGVGGMGVIYTGRQIFLDRKVAIKMLKSNLASVKARTRFHQEAKAASGLKHPGIVSILDFGVDDLDRPYMVMEHVEGCTIADLLDERMTLSVEDILPIFFEICDALSEAHKRGIVHRDLKPSNIMIVVDDDGDPHIKILDFGIAKVLEMEDRTYQDLTKTGDALGTPLYMSPEQVQSKNVTYKSDLYSLGCMLFACLTGTPPFIGENKMETMDLHCNAKPPSLHDASEGLYFPVGIEGIIQRLLEKKPENRYDSAEEFKNALIAMAVQNDFMPAPNRAAALPLNISQPPGGQRSITDANQPKPTSRPSPVDLATTDGDTHSKQQRIARNSNTTYWKSDLTDRVKAARADKPKVLPRPRRTDARADLPKGLSRSGQTDNLFYQEESQSSPEETSLKKTFVIAGAITTFLLLGGSVVAWLVLKPQPAATGQQITSSNSTQTAPSTISSTAPSAISSTAPSPMSSPAPSTNSPMTSATAFSTASKPSSGNGDSSTSTADADNSADLLDPSADDMIKTKYAAGAMDSSLSLQDKDGLTEKGLIYLEKFRLLRSLDLRGTSLPANAAKYLVNCPVTTLNFNGNKGVSDESLPYLARMKDLHYLAIDATNISDLGLRYLSRSPAILSLWLGHNKEISDQGVKNLSPRTSPLRSLFINNCNISDGAAEDLAQFAYMFSLDVSGNPKVSDHTMMVLQAKSKGLQFLAVAYDNIGDAGIRALSRFSKLKSLDVSGIRLSAAAQVDLATMKNLNNLYLVDCKLSPDEISRLTRALPSTTVETGNRLPPKNM